MAKLRKPKRQNATLLLAMARSSRRPHIGYSQGRQHRSDRGSRRAAIGGAFNASIPPTNEGVDNAYGETVSGSDGGGKKPSR